MSLVAADRVKETTITSGTGAVSLLGAVTGFQSFSGAVGNGNTCFYCIADQAGSNWEVGIGTYATSGNTLTRTTVLASSNAGSLVSFGSNTKDVFLTYPANKAVSLDASGQLIVPSYIGTNGVTPIRPIHSGANSSIEWVLEQLDAKANGRKWNHLVNNGNSTKNADYTLRILNDSGTGQTNVGFVIDGTTGKMSTLTNRALDPASVPSGSVIQAKWTDMGGGNYSGASASYVNTGFNASITPLFSTSKILHIVTIGVFFVCDGNLVIARNGTIVSPSLADSSRNSYDWYNDMPPLSFTWMDNPGSTSALTYSLWGRATGCANTVAVGSSSDFTTSWTMLEIAA